MLVDTCIHTQIYIYAEPLYPKYGGRSHACVLHRSHTCMLHGATTTKTMESAQLSRSRIRQRMLVPANFWGPAPAFRLLENIHIFENEKENAKICKRVGTPLTRFPAQSCHRASFGRLTACYCMLMLMLMMMQIMMMMMMMT
jgi:hypothetical protein